MVGDGEKNRGGWFSPEACFSRLGRLGIALHLKMDDRQSPGSALLIANTTIIYS